MAIFPQQLSGYVSEVGAAFLCAELGITQSVRPDHAQYLAHWLRLLTDHHHAIFTAAARASEAVAYLKGLQPVAADSAPRPLEVRPGASAKGAAVLQGGVP